VVEKTKKTHTMVYQKRSTYSRTRHTIWQNNPTTLVNISSGSLRNYWDITGYNPTTPTGTWSPVAITGSRQCWVVNPTICGIDTALNVTNFNYTFTQPGYYRVRLSCVNQFGTSFVEKPIFVSPPVRKPKAQFFADRRILGVYDQVQLYDLSTNGPSFWQWYMDPPCNNCGGLFFNTFNPTPNTASPSFAAYDPGTYKICLVVGNAMGTDTLCREEYIRVVSGYRLCSGSDSVSREDEGYIMSNILQAPTGYFYIANQCQSPAPPGFRIAPCADSIYISLERLRMRNTDSVYIRGGSYTGTILRRFGGSNINAYSDSLRNFRFGGQELFITWTPGTPNGTGVSVPDSGFSFRWTSLPAMYGPPTASFTIPDTVYTGYNLRVQNTTTGIKPVYAWDLNGDGVFGLDNPGLGVDSITTNPSITFGSLVPIQRTMCLKASNCVGSDTMCKTFWVLPVTQAPIADFTVNRTQGFTTDTFLLIDQSRNGPNQWRWRFEPNNVSFVPPFDSTSQNPLLFFNAPQSYNVTLVAINSQGVHEVKKFNVVTARAYGNPNSIFNPNAVAVDIGITRVTSGAMDTISLPKTPTYSPMFNFKRRQVFRGATYSVDVFRNTAADAQHMKVWIDWDRDASFNNNEELILNDEAQRKLKTTATFTVPANAPTGGTRMRIGAAADFSTTFTSLSATLGVYEDYGIDVAIDDVKPVVTLNGNAVFKTEVNRPFNDPWATAMDNIEGDISSRVQRIGTVDITQVGYYTLKYIATDYYGNVSDTVYRLVQVEVNQTGPGITLAGPDTVYLEVFTDTYNEPGFTALNNTGGNITHLVTRTTNLDTTTLGTYTMNYSVTDAFGFSASKTRTIIVRDTEKPTISSLSDRDTVNHQINTAYNDNDYIKIEDNYWGITTFTRTGNVNVNQQGIYTLRYRTTDGSGNQSDEYVLRVFVRDLIPPHIELKGAPEVEVPVFGPYTDAGVTAFDAVSNVTITNNIATALNINVVGTYTITYTATDASGNTASVERIIRVVDKVAPVIKLLGRNPFEMTRLEHYADVDPGYVVTDNYYPASQIMVTVDTSSLDTRVGGIYFVKYCAEDPSRNKSECMFREVVVNFITSLNSVTSGKEQLLVYPNPSSGRIYIDSKETIRSIKVMDMSGRIINTELSVDLSYIDIKTTGLVMVYVETDNGTYTERILIQQ
jgi:PKD repeat protein